MTIDGTRVPTHALTGCSDASRASQTASRESVVRKGAQHLARNAKHPCAAHAACVRQTFSGASMCSLHPTHVMHVLGLLKGLYA